jgi:hypothetical protein
MLNDQRNAISLSISGKWKSVRVISKIRLLLYSFDDYEAANKFFSFEFI